MDREQILVILRKHELFTGVQVVQTNAVDAANEIVELFESELAAKCNDCNEWVPDDDALD